MKAIFVVLFLFSFLADLVILILGKHTLIGMIQSVLFFAVFLRFHNQVLLNRSIWIRLAGWLGFYAILFAICFISRPPIRPVPAVSVKNPKSTPAVSVSQGELTGVFNESETVEVYAGIPYAMPPIGELRWKEPQDPAPWEGVRICDRFAPMSMQNRTNTVLSSLTDLFVYHKFRLSFSDNYLNL